MKYLRRRKYLLIFLLVLFLLSIGFGIVLFIKQSNNIKLSLISLDNIKESLLNNHISNLFEHFMIITIISILSLIFIGYIGGLFYFFYIGTSIGYTLTYLLYFKGLKGLLFGIVYNLYSKFVFLILFYLLLIKLFDIIRNIMGFLFYHKNVNLLRNFKYNYRKIIIIIIFILINDIILSFTSDFVLKLILPML